MRIWRLSSVRRATEFNGGMEFPTTAAGTREVASHLLFDRAIPCRLRKAGPCHRPSIVTAQIMVAYDVPDDIAIGRIEVSDLPADWTMRQTTTQAIVMDGSIG